MPRTDTPTETKQVDFLIIGSGAGSLAAALKIAEHGRNALIIEKQAKFGGSTAISGGVLWVPMSRAARDAGSVDSRADAGAYLDACIGEERPATSAARRAGFLDKGPECLDFLERLGMRWVFADGYSDYHEGEVPGGKARGRAIVVPMFDLRRLGHWADRIGANPALPPVMFHETVPLRWRGRTWASCLAYFRVGLRMTRNRLGARLVGMGAALYGRMLELALARKVELWSETRTLRFIEADGRVTGAEVQRHGRVVEITARCGVLLNTGGFSLNRVMRETYQPTPASTEWTLANPGDTGEMIQLAQDLGAALDLMDASWWVPGTILPGGIRMYLVPELQQPHGFVVDSSGRRYMNEATSYVAIGRAMYEREKTVSAVPSWLIMDRRYMEKYLIVGQSMRKIPQSWLDAGVLVQADSLEALGQRCGLPDGSLTTTTERFNGFARAGRDDDFGRGISAYNRLFGDPLHGPTPGLGTVEKPPFYAMPVYPNDVGTCGGLVTDEHARVLRHNGSVIEGLYATGNCTATVMGHSYPGAGASIAPSLIFGYIAAEHATMPGTSAGLDSPAHAASSTAPSPARAEERTHG